MSTYNVKGDVHGVTNVFGDHAVVGAPSLHTLIDDFRAKAAALPPELREEALAIAEEAAAEPTRRSATARLRTLSAHPVVTEVAAQSTAALLLALTGLSGG